MRKFSALAVISLACAAMANAQGRPIDWPSYGGDAQRTGWEKSDSRITKENIKEFQLVLKKKLGEQKGPHSLTPPVVIGNLISYRGFKELALIAGSSGDVWALDADLERLFWRKHLDSSSGGQSCSGDVAAIPALTPPMNFGARRPRPAPAAVRPAASPGRVGGTGFGVTRSVFALAGDGTLHQLNSADGSDQFPPLPFLPPNSKASSLTLQDGILYTTTHSGCGGAPNAVWAIDLNDAEPKPVSFVSKGGAAGGIGGFALGSDGTVYVQTEDSLLALTPKDLTLKQSFTAPGSSSVTPVVFTWKDKEMVVSAGKDGRLYLLDAQSPGGADHKTPVYRTAPIANGNPGIWGGLSSWEDGDGTRWVLAPVWGRVTATNGAIVAFKLEENNGKPVLTPAWVSRDMSSPEPPVITSGVVFALSAGAPHATLYALDGATGKEMYSTGNQVTAPGNLTGVTVANGRVYFTTTDSTVYAFGIYLER
jgi:outer membrane protein assembly factor BamB